MLGIFKRYILLIKNDIKAQLRYPLDFTMQIFIWFIYSFIPIMGLYILFERFGSIGEWGMYHIGYSYGVISFGYDLARMLGRGFDNFHKYTIDGSLDTLLIRPLSLKLQIMGNNFFLRRISGLINYTLILIISIFKLKPSIYFDLPIIMLMTVVLIISVSIFFMGLLLVYASSCIFTVHRNIISDLLVDNLVKVSYLPLNYINKILRFVLLYVIPIGIISYYPIKNILFGNSYSKLALSIFLSLSISNICIFITSKVFDFSLGSYKSTRS